MISGIVNTMNGLFIKQVLVDGIAHVISMNGAPIPSTITAYPVAGDTVLVEQSADNGVTWNPTALLNVTVLSNMSLSSGCTHIRCTRTAGAGITSYVTIC